MNEIIDLKNITMIVEVRFYKTYSLVIKISQYIKILKVMI